MDVPSWTLWVGCAAAVSTLWLLAKDAWEMRTKLLRTSFGKWLVMFFIKGKRLRAVEGKQTSIDGALADIQAAIGMRPKRKTILHYGVRWAAPEVRADSDPNVPFCPLCDEEGHDTCTSINEVLGNEYMEPTVKEIVLECDHRCHGPQVFRRILQPNQWRDARYSSEIRDATKRPLV